MSFSPFPFWGKLEPTRAACPEVVTDFTEYTLAAVSPMPVARIYASLVEEAEPICADLLARGYNVEVVFPDAVLTNPADLELRVERCSAEQAIARVEASGSPSRCVFVTPGKGPRRELLLVEMTVLATGTDGRHPMAMPIPVPEIALVAGHLTGAPMESVDAQSASSNLAEVLPFPVLPQVTAEPDLVATEEIPPPNVVDVAKEEQAPSRRRVSDQNLGKDLIAELNVFLAHAPVMERPEGLHVRIFENVRHSVGVERARKNWEGLTLAGVAASLVVLMALGWFAGPNRPRSVATVPQSGVLAAPPQAVPSAQSVDGANVRPVVLAMQTSGVPMRLATQRRHLVRRPHRRLALIQDDLVAQDHVVQSEPRSAEKLLSNNIFRRAQPTTTSELIRPAAIRSAPIKIITDLK